MTDAGCIRVMTVDDHPMLRDGIAAILATQADIVLVAEAQDGAEAVERFRTVRPDVTLMDLQMPRMGGIAAIQTILREFGGARIIVLTTYQGDMQAVQAFKAGAVGYILKSMVRRDLPDIIRAAHAGRRHVPPEIAAELALHVGDALLTERELEILRLVAAGQANKQIARALAIAEDTVKAHLKKIFVKLDASDRAHAVILAVRRGFIEA